jgi:methyl-accepting chemotaxis protein
MRRPRGALPVIATLVLGLIVALAAYYLQSSALDADNKRDYDSRALLRGLTMEQILREHVAAGETIKAFYSASNSVDRDEFDAFVGNQMPAYPAIQWLAWVPRVTDSDRAQVVKDSRGQGLADYDFRRVDTDGKVVSAGPARSYLPVHYLQAAKQAQDANRLLGVDLASVPVWAKTMSQAMESGEVATAWADPSVAAIGRKDSVIFFQPIYRNGLPRQTAEQRRENLIGFAVGLIDVPTVVARTLEYASPTPGGVHFALHMDTGGAKQTEIHYHRSRNANAAYIAASELAKLTYDHHFKLANIDWTVVTSASEGFFEGKDMSLPWKVVGGIMLLAGLIAGYFVLAMRTSSIRAKTEAERLALAEHKARENDVLNDSIIDILRSVAKLSRGDLTVKSPVKEDVTGALSDAINAMAESTAKTLAGVNEVSEEVRQASQVGRASVLDAAKGMNDIRSTIQETGKRIKRLGERSQEIGGMVKLIDDIAERTSVLALNANMQAAAAGEAGRGFRVVADEVQRLAERSKEATDQIAKLVTNIQMETNETMATMDRAIGDVVKGGELAERAAAQVDGLGQLGDELVTAVQAFKLPEGLLKAPERQPGRVDTRRVA